MASPSGPHLSCPVPEPVHAGTPTDAFPLVWSVYRWIDGDEAGPGTVRDWAGFGADLAAVVRSSTASTSWARLARTASAGTAEAA